MDKRGNLIPKHRLKPQNDEKWLKPQIDKRGLKPNVTHRLKPRNDMTHVMLDAKSLLDMQTWSQPCGGANENLVMQMSFMRMQMQI